jgi:MoxR-like ATPase
MAHKRLLRNCVVGAMNRVTRIASLVSALCEGLYEREEIVKLSLLTALAGESIFLLGPPGVGKSLVARKLKFAFKDATSFEYLMTRFSTPDEVFGPISIKKLKDEDKYERLTDKYLPGAQIVFLDEIWKSSAAIQNALLTILNERVYRNGEQEVPVAIHAIITASNELPNDQENFAALYDRFLMRYEMQPIKEQRNFLRMITATDAIYEDPVPEELKITKQELAEWAAAIDAVAVPEPVLQTIQMLRFKMEAWNTQHADQRPLEVLDRRWKKLIRLLRTSAFLNNRTEVDLMDCFLLAHGLWSHPNQLETIAKMLGETIRHHGYSLTVGLTALREEIAAFEAEVEAETQIVVPETTSVLKPYEDAYYKLVKTGAAFEGAYIAVKEYNQLQRGEKDILNFYDAQFKLVNRLQVAQSPTPFTLQVKHNAVVHEMSLETYLQASKKVVLKKPHALVSDNWVKRHHATSSYLQTQIQLLEQQKPGALQGINNHLFVDQLLAPFVTENFDKVVAALEQLQLRLEKLQHYFLNINR